MLNGYFIHRIINEMDRITHSQKYVTALKTTILHYDEVLTMSARMAAATGDDEWEIRYNDYEPKLDQAILEASRFVSTSQLNHSIGLTNQANQALVAMEKHAFKLAKKGQLAQARDILFGEYYTEQKNAYLKGIERFSAYLDHNLKTQLDDTKKQFLFIFSLSLAIGTIAIFSWIVTTKHINRWRKQKDAMYHTLNEIRKQLETSVASLNFTNAKLEHYAYVASHDLKEPLRNLTSFAQMIQEEQHKKLNKETKEYLRYIIDNAKVMEKLISDLLSYAKMEHDKQPKKDIDLNLLVKEVLSHFEQELTQENVTIHYSALPHVYSNPTLLMQILQNLISNAIKYRHPDRACMISITCKQRKNRLSICVSDNGIGIDKEFQEAIFEPFKRLHNKRTYPGTGIGLSICKKAVESLGGTLRVKSALHEGSQFFIELDIPAEAASDT